MKGFDTADEEDEVAGPTDRVTCNCRSYEIMSHPAIAEHNTQSICEKLEDVKRDVQWRLGHDCRMAIARPNTLSADMNLRYVPN